MLRMKTLCLLSSDRHDSHRAPRRGSRGNRFQERRETDSRIACVTCHGPENDKGGLRLHTLEAALKGGRHGTRSKPGKPDESPFITTTILPPDHEEVMPPKKNGPLAKQQTEMLRDWITAGAIWPEGLVVESRQRVNLSSTSSPSSNCTACRVTRKATIRAVAARYQRGFRQGRRHRCGARRRRRLEKPPVHNHGFAGG